MLVVGIGNGGVVVVLGVIPGEVLRSCTLMYDLYKMTKASTLKEMKREVFEVFQRQLRVANWNGAFKTIDCKKMNQVKLRA